MIEKWNFKSNEVMKGQETEFISTWVEVAEDQNSGGMMLFGDQSGLTALRDAVDAAIISGEAPIAAMAVEFCGVRRVDAPRKSEPSSFLSAVVGVGCLMFIAFCFLIFLFGIWQLKSLIFTFGTLFT